MSGQSFLRPNKPVVYIASPYSIGDTAINVHFQARVFDELLSEGLVLPIAPLWSHFQHTLFPRPYADWIAYDLEILKICDACLRLDAVNSELSYVESRSQGADEEVRMFLSLGRPVFYSRGDLTAWARAA